MRSFASIALICAVGTLSLGATTATPDLGLEGAFKAALQKSELVSTQTELVTQAEENYKQARGALLPNINGVATYLVQQAPPGGIASTASPSDQTNIKLTANQPLFQGMREYAGLSQRNLQVTAQISAKRQTVAQLYSDVVTNFYGVLSAEQFLRDLQREIEIDQKRIVDLNARIRIGRSQKSEVLTMQSAVDSLAAQMEATRGQISALRQGFAFLTGMDAATPIREEENVEVKLGTLETYLGHIEDRPDVKAARDSLEAVDKGVTIARAGHFPTVDLTGDYYFKRSGLPQNQHWDVVLTGTVPIFAGGIVNSQVRQAASQTRASELNLDRTRRLADQEIRTDYSNVAADIAQVSKLEQAAKSAQENYATQSKDYKLGLVTNLDVLQAITSSQQTERALDTARYQAKLDYLKLETAIAQRPKNLTGALE